MYTITVTKTENTSSDYQEGSFFWAIQQANNYSGDDEVQIVFAPELSGKTLTYHDGNYSIGYAPMIQRAVSIVASGEGVFLGTSIRLQTSASLYFENIATNQIYVYGKGQNISGKNWSVVQYQDFPAGVISVIGSLNAWNGSIDLSGITSITNNWGNQVNGTLYLRVKTLENATINLSSNSISYGVVVCTQACTTYGEVTMNGLSGPSWFYLGGDLRIKGTLNLNSMRVRKWDNGEYTPVIYVQKSLYANDSDFSTMRVESDGFVSLTEKSTCDNLFIEKYAKAEISDSTCVDLFIEERAKAEITDSFLYNITNSGQLLLSGNTSVSSELNNYEGSIVISGRDSGSNGSNEIYISGKVWNQAIFEVDAGCSLYLGNFYLFSGRFFMQQGALHLPYYNSSIRIYPNAMLCLDDVEISGSTPFTLMGWTGNTADAFTGVTRCTFTSDEVYIGINASFERNRNAVLTLSSLPFDINGYIIQGSVQTLTIDNGLSLKISNPLTVTDSLTFHHNHVIGNDCTSPESDGCLIIDSGTLTANTTEFCGTICIRNDNTIFNTTDCTFSAENVFILSNWSGSTEDIFAGLRNAQFTSENARIIIDSLDNRQTAILTSTPTGLSACYHMVRDVTAHQLELKRGAKLDVSHNILTIQDRLICNTADLLGDTISLLPGSTLDLHATIVENSIHVGYGCTIYGENSMFLSATPFILSQWEGNTSHIFENLRDCSFANENKAVSIESLHGDTTLASLPKDFEGGYVFASPQQIEVQLTIEDGTVVYSPHGDLIFTGSIEAQGTVSMMGFSAHELQSTNQRNEEENRLIVAGNCNYNRLEIDGTLYLRQGAQLTGEELILHSRYAAIVEASYWDGADLFATAGNICLTHEKGAVLYDIRGVDGDVISAAELQAQIKHDTFDTRLLSLTLKEGQTLYLKKGDILEVSELHLKGGQLIMEEGASISGGEEQCNIYAEGASITSFGGQINGILHFDEKTRIEGTTLLFSEDSEAFYEGMSLDTNDLQFQNFLSKSQGLQEIEIKAEDINIRQKVDIALILQSNDDCFNSLTLGENAEVFIKSTEQNSALVNFESINLDLNSRIKPWNSKEVAIQFNQFIGNDCDIDTSIYIPDNAFDVIINGQNIRLNAQRAISVPYFHPYYIDSEILEKLSAFSFTQESSYVNYRLKSAHRFDNETIKSLRLPGCNQVAFSGITSSLILADDTDFFIADSLECRRIMDLGKHCSLKSAASGSYVAINDACLFGSDTIFEIPLSIDYHAGIQGDNYHFTVDGIAVNVTIDYSLLTSDIPPSPLFREVTYDVLNDNALIGLTPNGFVDTPEMELTNELLNRVKPAGFKECVLTGFNAYGMSTVFFTDLKVAEWDTDSYSGMQEVEQVSFNRCSVISERTQTLHFKSNVANSRISFSECNIGNTALHLDNYQYLEFKNCSSFNTIALSSAQKVSVVFAGNDLSTAIFDLSNFSGAIDLSGNFWGTSDRELILSRIQNKGNVDIRLDSIIPARDEVGFTFSAAQVADLNMSSADTRLTLAFTHAIDAASVTKDSIKLFTEGGEELPLLSTEVKGRTLILHTAQLPIGSYRLVVSSALKDTDGNEFNYHGQSTGELALSVTENAATNERAKVLLTIPNSTLFSDFRYIDIYYDREMDEADISAQNIHLFDSEGRECGIETISTLKNSKGDTFYRVLFKKISGQGSYQLAISGVADATGAQSIEPYYQELVLATPDLEVAGDIRISETISGRYATVTYSVTNKADGKVDGTWYDSAYLCPTAEWDEAHAILLGRKCHTVGSLGARESYTNTLKFLLNGIADGDYYLFVRTDSSDRLNETNEANNLMAYSEKVSIRGKEHPLSTQTEVLESRNETLNYTFTAAENGIMSFGISIANAKIRITAAGGAAPAQPALLSTDDGTEAFFYAIAGGTYDINIETRCTGAVTTTLKKATFGLTQTSRTELIAGRTIGIVVHGSAFEKGMRLYLQDMNGNIYEQDALDVYDFFSAKVTFTLPKEIAEGAVLQLYAVDKQQTSTVALKQSLVAHAAGGIDFADANDLSIQLRAPGTGGRDYAYSSRVGYVWEAHMDVKNDSVNDEPNALILVTDTSADLSLYYNYAESEHLDRTALLLLAGTRDASPNELLAQEQETLGIFLRSYRSNTGYIEAQVLSAQDESYIPEERWAELGSALRPAKVSEQEWNDWWGNMRPRIGSTVADFSAFVHDILALAYPEGAKPSSALADAVLSVMQHQPNYLPCFKISGMVTDDAGGAYAGARLELYTVQDGERKLTDWAESDADGNYALYGMRQGLTYELVCNKPFTFEGNTVTRITMEAEGDTVLNLAAPACIGRVEIPLPAVGDSARAYLTAEDGKIINLQRQGSLFFAEHVAGGSYTLFVCTADGASYSETLQIPTEATDVFRYQTTPLGCVGGTLLQADGITPESGQSLVLTSQHTIIAAAVTDADGQFRFTLVPAGEYTLESYDDTFKPQLITIPADGSVLIENILTERGLTVTGMMEGLHAGHCVELRHESGLRYFGYTDANGRFSISAVPAGVYRLYTDTAQVSPRELVLEAAGAADVELGSFSLPDKPRLSGQLSCGGLSANGTVTLYKDGEAVGSVMTDANGRFNFLVNSPGTYTVFAVAENGSFCCTPQQIMAEAQQENADIMLECGTGYAALENINFLTKETALSATLSYVGDAAEYEIVTLNSLSALAAGFAGLAAGSYRLVINTEKERHTATFHVGNGERTAIGDFVATPLHSFRLQVVIGDKAAPQADVYLYGDNNVLVAHAQADENGLASFKNLPEGIYRCVSFSADGAFSQELEWNLRDTSDSTIELEAPQNSISGTLSGHATGTAGQTIVQVKDDAGVLIGSGTVQSDGTYLIGTLTGSRAVRLEAYNPTTGQTAAADMTPGATVQPELQLRDADEDAVIPLQPEEEQEKQPEIHLVSPTKLTQQLNAKNRTVTLTWETAAPNPPGTTYELVYSYQALPNGTWSAPHHMALGNVNSVTMPVEDESLYTWRIIAHHPDTAVTAAGDIRNFKVDFSAPGIPTGISILKEAKEADKRCNDISVSWEKSVDVSAIKGYNVLVSAGPAASKSQATFVTGLSVNASNLEDGYYYVHIQAVDEFDNESEWAHEMFLIDTTAPTLTGLNAPQVAGDNAFITWGAAQDISSIDGYDLLLTDTQTGLQQIIQLNGDVTSYMLRDLSGGAYTVRVRAYDTNNNISDWSESRSFLIERTPERSRRPSDAIDELQYQLYTRLKNQLVASDVITTRCCSDRNFKLAYMQQRDAWEAATADLAEVQQLWDEFVQGVQAEAVALGTIVATLLVSTEAAVAITAGSVLLGGAAFIHEFIESVRGFNRANAVEGLISILSGAANVMSDTASLGNLAEAARKFDRYQELLKHATAPDAAQRLAALRELENNPFVRDYANGMRVTVPALLTGRSAQQLARSFRATSQFLDRVSFVLQVISGWQLFRQYQEINTRLESLFNDVDSIGNYISDAMEQKQQLLDCIQKSPCENPDPQPARLGHQSFASFDPNDIYGPQSYGDKGWIKPQEMQFAIECENIAKENIAHTAMVTITHHVDEAFDYSTFRLGDMMIAGNTIHIEDDIQNYKARVDWTATLGVLADVNVVFDADTGDVTWEFIALDPETHRVINDPFAGLLAPNYHSPEGEGMVYYTVTPKGGTATGTEFSAQADIIFDFNEVIQTPVIRYTIDNDAPEAAVNALPEISDTPYLLVSWQGHDVGSGMAAYNVYVSVDGGAWQLWQQDIAATEALFRVEAGEHLYAFMAEATDRAGNTETTGETVAAEAHTVSLYSGAGGVLGVKSITGRISESELGIAVSFTAAAECRDWSSAVRLTVGGHELDTQSGTFDYDAELHLLTWRGEPQGSRAGQGLSLTLDTRQIKGANGASLSRQGLSFSAAAAIEAAGEAYAAPTLYDYDGDGLLDLLVGENAGGVGQIRLYLNEGSAEAARFSTYRYLTTAEDTPLTVEAEGCQGAIVRFADLNGDGADEMFIGQADGSIRRFLATADGHWADAGLLTYLYGGREETMNVSERAAIDFCDLNSDGIIDILIGTGSGNIAIFYGTQQDGTVIFTEGQYLHDSSGRITIGSRASVTAGDFDGDGLLDLLVGSSTGTVLFYRNAGNAATPLFTEGTAILLNGSPLELSAQSNRLRITAADLNGDGTAELLMGLSDGRILQANGMPGKNVRMDTALQAGKLPQALKVRLGTPVISRGAAGGITVSLAWTANQAATYTLVLDGNTIYHGTDETFTFMVESGPHSWSITAEDADGNTLTADGIRFSENGVEASDIKDIRLSMIDSAPVGNVHNQTALRGTLCPTDAHDYYSFTATADGTYQLGLRDLTLGDMVLAVGQVSADGFFRAQYSIPTGANYTNAIEGINLRKGETAYIRISSEAAAETAYELRVAGEVPAAASITDNNTAATADALVGSTAPAAVEGWVGAGDACDFYRLQLAEASNLQLSLSGVDTAARVKVYAEQADGSRALLSAGTATAVSGLDRTLALTAGSYYIEVAALNPDGGLGNSAYTMELKEQKGKQSTHYMLAAR